VEVSAGSEASKELIINNNNNEKIKKIEEERNDKDIYHFLQRIQLELNNNNH
jgi:hypothetical protein